MINRIEGPPNLVQLNLRKGGVHYSFAEDIQDVYGCK